MPLTFLSLINKGFQRPELKRTYRTRKAAPFLVKIWVIFGACGEGSASILSNPTVAKGGMLGSEKIRSEVVGTIILVAFQFLDNG